MNHRRLCTILPLFLSSCAPTESPGSTDDQPSGEARPDQAGAADLGRASDQAVAAAADLAEPGPGPGPGPVEEVDADAPADLAEPPDPNHMVDMAQAQARDLSSPPGGP